MNQRREFQTSVIRRLHKLAPFVRLATVAAISVPEGAWLFSEEVGATG